MNKKCKLCNYRSDKCKNPYNPNYDRYIDDIVNCSGYKLEARMINYQKIAQDKYKRG